MNTIYGPCIGDGLALRTRHYPNRFGAWETERRTWANPICEVRSRQPARIPVNVNHWKDEVCGQVIHLEVFPGPPERLMAVAEVDEDVVLPSDEPTYWSVETVSDEGTGADVEITGLGLVGKSAQLGLTPVKLLRGDLSYRGAERRWRTGLTPYERGLLARAAQARFYRRHDDAIVVREASEFEGRNLDRLSEAERYMLLTEQHERRMDVRPPGKLEYRPSKIIAVR